MDITGVFVATKINPDVFVATKINPDVLVATKMILVAAHANDSWKACEERNGA